MSKKTIIMMTMTLFLMGLLIGLSSARIQAPVPRECQPYVDYALQEGEYSGSLSSEVTYAAVAVAVIAIIAAAVLTMRKRA